MTEKMKTKLLIAATLIAALTLMVLISPAKADEGVMPSSEEESITTTTPEDVSTEVSEEDEEWAESDSE